MAKRATTKIKGASPADKQNIALAKAANAADDKAGRARTTDDGEPVRVTQRTTDTPEAQETPRQKRDAAEKLFQKADEAGKAELIQEASLSRAVRG